jgi:uncharacterized membrane protein
MTAIEPTRRRLCWPGFLLGFGLGGFFDGILLHQVLQWHHLLSAVDGEGWRDIRVQILADGLFHLLMYLIVALALFLLWRGRGQAPGRTLGADAILGFGAWQLLDIVLFHWILGIHHIRMAAESWLAWDVGWFVVFGLPALLFGFWLRSRSEPSRPSGGRHVAVVLAAGVSAAGGVAMLPPAEAQAKVVVFGPGADATHSLQALAASGATVMWLSKTGGAAAITPDGDVDHNALRQNGGYLIGRSFLPPGCFSGATTRPSTGATKDA